MANVETEIRIPPAPAAPSSTGRSSPADRDRKREKQRRRKRKPPKRPPAEGGPDEPAAEDDPRGRRIDIRA